MKIGIISDTHNDAAMTKRALDAFHERGVEFVIHAGDLTSPEMISLFREFNTKFILGNGDTDHKGIFNACASAGFENASRCCQIELEGKKIFICHGDDAHRYFEAVDSHTFDYIIIGHTHEFGVKNRRNSIIINPGAVVNDNHTNSEQTCAVLDIETGNVEKIVLLDEDGLPE